MYPSNLRETCVSIPPVIWDSKAIPNSLPSCYSYTSSILIHPALWKHRRQTSFKRTVVTWASGTNSQVRATNNGALVHWKYQTAGGLSKNDPSKSPEGKWTSHFATLRLASSIFNLDPSSPKVHGLQLKYNFFTVAFPENPFEVPSTSHYKPFDHMVQ